MSEIAIHRLYRQQLVQPACKTPAALVAWFVAVQSQDYAGAKWSLGMRLPGSTASSIEQAIAPQKILRTWPVRGTLHFILADDIRWLLELVGPRIIASSTRRYTELELDEATLTRSSKLLAGVLQDGRQMSRKELLAYLGKNGISTHGQRAPYLLQRASLEGLICQIGMPRSNPVYLSIDSAAPHAKRLSRTEALAELALRYFNSRGPATLHDFIWWSGLLAADARAGLEAVQSQLVPETIHSQEYWRPSSLPPSRPEPPALHLLPSYDEFLISYKDRSASLSTSEAGQVQAANGLNPVFIFDGRVAGTWKRTFRKGSALLELKPFKPLNQAELAALNAAVLRFSQYLEMPVEYG